MPTTIERSYVQTEHISAAQNVAQQLAERAVTMNRNLTRQEIDGILSARFSLPLTDRQHSEVLRSLINDTYCEGEAKDRRSAIIMKLCHVPDTDEEIAAYEAERSGSAPA